MRHLVPLLLCSFFAHAATAQTQALDPSLDLLRSGSIDALSQQADGKLIVAGNFRVRGSSQGMLVRFDANGALDTSWNPTANLPLYVPAGHLAVAADSAYFTTNSGTYAYRIPLAGTGAWDADFSLESSDRFAQILPTDQYVFVVDQRCVLHRHRLATGVLDDSWPDVACVRHVTAGADGKLWAWRGGIARIDPDTGAVETLAAVAYDGDVTTLTVGGGYAYIGGAFTHVGGVARNGIARFALGAGASLDANWNPDPQLAGGGARVDDIVIEPGGSVLVGGRYDHIGGHSQNNLARLDGATGQVAATWQAQADGEVATILRKDDGSLLVGGTYARIAGTPAASIARLHSDGSLDTQFSAAAYLGAFVGTIAHDPASRRTYIGGGFDFANGQPHHNLLRLNADGSVDASWTPRVDSPLVSVDAFAFPTADQVLVGGSFDRVDDVPQAALARLDSHTGSLDTSWNPAPSMPADFSLVPEVRSLAIDVAGRVYVGGDFLKIAGVQTGSLVRFAANGTLDTAWQPGENLPVTRLFFDPARSSVFYLVANADGRLRANKVRTTNPATIDTAWQQAANATAIYAMGLDSAHGVYLVVPQAPPNSGPARVVRVSSASGALDASWNAPSGCDVSNMALDTSGNVYVAGPYPIYSPGPVDDRTVCLQRLSPTGALDPGFAPGWVAGPGNGVTALGVGAGDNLHVSGIFSQVSGQPRPNYAILPGADRLFRGDFGD